MMDHDDTDARRIAKLSHVGNCLGERAAARIQALYPAVENVGDETHAQVLKNWHKMEREALRLDQGSVVGDQLLRHRRVRFGCSFCEAPDACDNRGVCARQCIADLPDRGSAQRARGRSECRGWYQPGG
ncbi:MAG: hypothetical protein Q8P60_12420 [Pseudorhodobacter sp.]|nr:hypothetical protein [Pseudorhodobacter sp.]